MRNLVVCCDGTWNTPDHLDWGLPAPTNVTKIFNAVDDVDATGQEQLKYYHPGVGAEGSWWRRMLAGGIGAGLGENVKSAYQWLACYYKEPDDRIYLFGFSRGAYTVRSLGGLINCCGLLDISNVNDPDEAWRRIDLAFEYYRLKGMSEYWKRQKISEVKARQLAILAKQKFEELKLLKFHNRKQDQDPAHTTNIHFMGVWDTVGSLGIPNDLGLLDLFDDPKQHSFHNTKLSAIVRYARHAVAMDEPRESFTPLCGPTPKVKQTSSRFGFRALIRTSAALRSHGPVGWRSSMDDGRGRKRRSQVPRRHQGPIAS